MSPRGFVIVGAGGLGRSLVDVAQDMAAALSSGESPPEILGFLDDGHVDARLLERRGVRLLGRVEDFSRFADRFILGIADWATRKRIALELEGRGGTPVQLVDPLARVSRDAEISDGVMLFDGARIGTAVRLGRHVLVHHNSSVGHDCVVGDYVNIFPGVNVGGDVHIAPGVTIGSGASVLPGVNLGEGAYVGSGSVVVQDVAPGAVVVGVPAHPLPMVRSSRRSHTQAVL